VITKPPGRGALTLKENIMSLVLHYSRLRELQYRCWHHGHKKWATDIGREMQALLLDNPGAWQQDVR
jgi:hypothetical protein